VEWFKDESMQERLKKLYTEDMGMNKAVLKEFVCDNTSGKKDNGNIIWMLILLKELSD
jgi:hypothetical protein